MRMSLPACRVLRDPLLQADFRLMKVLLPKAQCSPRNNTL